jgi:hypothetical protein
MAWNWGARFISRNSREKPCSHSSHSTHLLKCRVKSNEIDKGRLQLGWAAHQNLLCDPCPGRRKSKKECPPSIRILTHHVATAYCVKCSMSKPHYQSFLCTRSKSCHTKIKTITLLQLRYSYLSTDIRHRIRNYPKPAL